MFRAATIVINTNEVFVDHTVADDAFRQALVNACKKNRIRIPSGDISVNLRYELPPQEGKPTLFLYEGHIPIDPEHDDHRKRARSYRVYGHVRLEVGGRATKTSVAIERLIHTDLPKYTEG